MFMLSSLYSQKGVRGRRIKKHRHLQIAVFGLLESCQGVDDAFQTKEEASKFGILYHRQHRINHICETLRSPFFVWIWFNCSVELKHLEKVDQDTIGITDNAALLRCCR